MSFRRISPIPFLFSTVLDTDPGRLIIALLIAPAVPVRVVALITKPGRKIQTSWYEQPFPLKYLRVLVLPQSRVASS